MFLTEKQLTELQKAPLTVTYADEAKLPGWHLKAEDDGRIEVIFDHFTIRNWSRFITLEGRVERWDEELEMFVDATWEPLMGSYVTTSDGKTHTYRY